MITHTYDPETGRKISPFTFEELRTMGVCPEEAAHIIYGIPPQGQPVKLRSIDGFRVEFVR